MCAGLADNYDVITLLHHSSFTQLHLSAVK